MMLWMLSGALAALPPIEELRGADPVADRAGLHHRGAADALLRAEDPHLISDWDIQHYTAHVRVDPDTQTVTGTMTITATRLEWPGDFLYSYVGRVTSATVDGVAVDPEPVGYDDAYVLHPAGDTTTVVLTWTQTGSWPDVGIRFDDGIAWSLDEPDGARNWMPVYDEPWDKATWTWEIEAPAGLEVVANGTLTQTVQGAPEADGRSWDTWTFDFPWPIATYLAALHVGALHAFTLSSDIPVTIYADTRSEFEVTQAFGTTGEMLDFLSDRYGAYPFDQYRNVIVPFGGAMEHPTCTSFGDVYFNRDAELVNVHEMGHHWFGDDVTLADWRDIWLNEGFASYTEALWYERAYGPTGLTDYVSWQRDTYYAWKSSEGDFALYDPDYLWGGTVYEKGSWVVHMLRGLVGDEAFFAALRDYLDTYGGANASTSEFEESFEQSTGRDLSWFFDAYVYGTGEPTFQFGYQPDGDSVIVAIESDMDLPFDVPVRLTTSDGTVDRTVHLQDGSACVRLEAGAAVTDAALDPDLWILTLDRLTLPDAALASCAQALDDDTGATDTGTTRRPGAYGGAPDCGCASAGGGAGWGVLAALALVLRRR